MVDLKTAVVRAMEFAQEALGEERTQAMRLEEVKSTKTPSGDAWVLTIGMLSADAMPVQIAMNVAPRVYKSFTVLKDNGDVLSMEIRELTNS